MKKKIICLDKEYFNNESFLKSKIKSLQYESKPYESPLNISPKLYEKNFMKLKEEYVNEIEELKNTIKVELFLIFTR